MLADVIKAQEAPRSRTIEIGRLERRLELTWRIAARDRALRPCTLNPTVQSCSFARHASSLAEHFYIGLMDAQRTGPVATEILARLNSTLSPTRVELVDDSEQHRGHGGYNPAGESHFSLHIESPQFVGKNRVQRQRMIYAALGDLMQARVHALSIRATAPGES